MNSRFLLFIITLVFFIITLILTITSYIYLKIDVAIPYFLLIFVNYHLFFMVLLSIIAIFFGIMIQYLSQNHIEKTNNKYLKLKELFFKNLDNDKKLILEFLIKNNGVITQYELTKLNGLNKLKVSRLLIEMEKDKLIVKERIGKINKIFLNSQIKNIFL